MLKYIVAALCFFAVCEAAAVSLKTGPVDGIVPCGSAGTILQVRVTNCTRVPCQLFVGGTYIVEIDFIPSQSHPQLRLNVTLFHQGVPYPMLDGPVENSAVEAGNAYTFTYPIEVEGFIIGLSDLRIQISGFVSGLIELCGIAGINVQNAVENIIF